MCRGKVKAVFRVAVPKAEVEGEDLKAARAKDRVAEAIMSVVVVNEESRFNWNIKKRRRL